MAVFLLSGCGNGKKKIKSCPADLVYPNDVTILGHSNDANLFVLRMESADKSPDELFEFFREQLQLENWKLTYDSSSENGGELRFEKENSVTREPRKCTVFIGAAKNNDEELLKIDIRCDRGK